MKRFFPIHSAVFVFLTFYIVNISAAHAATEASKISPDEAVQQLKAGNLRYKSGRSKYINLDSKRRNETVKGQHPFASIIGCSDSRVPIEPIFDAGIGDIFVIRVAGNVIDTDEAGSIEYGVDHLGTPVLVVLGHSKCGAVTAVTRGEEIHGNIPLLVDNITPAVKKAKKIHGSTISDKLIEEAIVLNVWQSIEDLFKRSHITANRVKDKKLKVIGAVYHLDTGEVKWLGEHPTQSKLLVDSNILTELKEQPFLVIMTGAVPLIFLLFFILFIGRKKIVQKIQIKGRLLASFISFVIIILLSSITGYIITTIYPGYYSFRVIMVSALLSAFISLIFSLIFAGSILKSFHIVIDTLKNK